MKRGKYLFFLFTLCGLFQSCNIPELPGSIYGTVEDKATGEPIKSVWVELLPSGLKTTTGSDGAFEFIEIDPSVYSLSVRKAGYIDYASDSIIVRNGQTVKADIQIERLPPALMVVDDNRNKIDTLNFGGAEDDLARSFNIFNDGDAPLEWQITKTAEWIKLISKTEGKLAAGATQSIVVVIDRTKLGFGENRTTLHITSNNGSKQLAILATGPILATLNTLPATNIKTTSAMLNGEILNDGNPKYTERGFVFSESSMPTIGSCIQKVTSTLTDSKTYSATIGGLTKGKTYYTRAYAISADAEVYSTNEVSFAPNVYLPQVETVSAKPVNDTSIYLIGNIVDAGDPEYTERGFIYATIQYPTLDDANVTKVVITKTSSTRFEKQVNINGLSQNMFYVRAYAESSEGVSYGKVIELATPEYLEYSVLPTFKHEGNKYRVHPGFNISSMDWFQAISMCENLTYGGFSDWILPSVYELMTMYANQAQIGRFYHSVYWSSTIDDNPDYAWVVFFSSSYEYSSGSTSPLLKFTSSMYTDHWSLNARCVRKED